jgi:hypothetical protein
LNPILGLAGLWWPHWRLLGAQGDSGGALSQSHSSSSF